MTTRPKIKIPRPSAQEIPQPIALPVIDKMAYLLSDERFAEVSLEQLLSSENGMLEMPWHEFVSKFTSTPPFPTLDGSPSGEWIKKKNTPANTPLVVLAEPRVIRLSKELLEAVPYASEAATPYEVTLAAYLYRADPNIPAEQLRAFDFSTLISYHAIRSASQHSRERLEELTRILDPEMARGDIAARLGVSNTSIEKPATGSLREFFEDAGLAKNSGIRNYMDSLRNKAILDFLSSFLDVRGSTLEELKVNLFSGNCPRPRRSMALLRELSDQYYPQMGNDFIKKLFNRTDAPTDNHLRFETVVKAMQNGLMSNPGEHLDYVEARYSLESRSASGDTPHERDSRKFTRILAGLVGDSAGGQPPQNAADGSAMSQETTPFPQYSVRERYGLDRNTWTALLKGDYESMIAAYHRRSQAEKNWLEPRQALLDREKTLFEQMTSRQA